MPVRAERRDEAIALLTDLRGWLGCVTPMTLVLAEERDLREAQGHSGRCLKMLERGKGVFALSRRQHGFEPLVANIESPSSLESFFVFLAPMNPNGLA